MKTTLAAVLVSASMLCAYSASARPAITWGSASPFTATGTGPDILDWNGNAVPTSSTFLVLLLNASSPSPSTPLHTASSSFWSGFTTQMNDSNDYPGVGFIDIPQASGDETWNGVSLLTRIYNSSIVATATKYADALGSVDGGTNLLSWTGGDQATEKSYDIGTIRASDWKSTNIPEPGTLMFSLSALGVLAVRRLRQRN